MNQMLYDIAVGTSFALVTTVFLGALVISSVMIVRFFDDIHLIAVSIKKESDRT